MDLLRYLIYYGSYFVFPFIIFLGVIFFRRKDRMMRVMMSILFLLSVVFIYARFVEPRILLVAHEEINIGEGSDETARLRFALIADTHLGMFKNAVSMERIVEKIKKENVDAVFIAGDFVYHASNDELEKLFGSLNDLDMPIFAVMGNHDMGVSGREILKKMNFSEDLSALLSKYDVKIMDNKMEKVEINGVKLTVIGLGDLWAGEADFSVLEESVESENTVVLAHNPDVSHYFPADSFVDLVLSGHTHGGQIRIPILYKYALPTKFGFNKGLYNVDGMPVFVTSGTGMVGLPMRFLVPPEIDIIEVIL